MDIGTKVIKFIETDMGKIPVKGTFNHYPFIGMSNKAQTKALLQLTKGAKITYYWWERKGMLRRSRGTAKLSEIDFRALTDIVERAFVDMVQECPDNMWETLLITTEG